MRARFTVLQVMHYVYLIESVQDRTRHYVGETTDLRRRLQAHIAGQSVYTRDLKPWRLACHLGFASQTTAKTFERYLKSGSGKNDRRDCDHALGCCHAWRGKGGTGPKSSGMPSTDPPSVSCPAAWISSRAIAVAIDEAVRRPGKVVLSNPGSHGRLEMPAFDSQPSGKMHHTG
jgi:putative endonuclease